MAKPNPNILQILVGMCGDPVYEYHIRSVDGTGYDTLCGLDAHDPDIGTYGSFPAPAGKKVTCQQCTDVYFGVKALRLSTTNFTNPPQV